MEYERDETDCRLAHTLHTEVDDVGNVLESASVVYGRKQSKADAAFQALSDSVTDFAEDAPEGGEAQLQDAFAENIQSAKDEQTKTRIVFTRSGFARHSGGSADADLPRAYRLRLPHETEVYELTGFAPAGDLFAREELKGALGEAQEIAYHEAPGGGKQRRLTEHIKFKYLDDSLNALDFGFFDTLGLSYENYRKAYTTELAKDIFQKEDGTELQAGGENASGLIEEKGRLVSIGGGLWIRSGLIRFKDEGEADAGGARSRFFSPVAYENPFGSVTSVTYDTETFAGADRNSDGYYLYIKSVADAADNKVQIGRFNYRTMSPARIIDLNANPASVLTDELGLVKALAAEGNGVFADETRTETNIAEAADSLEGLKEYADAAEEAALAQLFGAADALGTDTAQLRQAGSSLLGKASVRFAYDFGTFQSGGSRPAAAVSVSREEHYSDNAQSGVLFGFEYSGGLGNVVMSKAQAEPGMAFYTENGQRKEKDTGAELRWTGSGRTVLNNKGNPVKQYEPYFSTNFLYEDASELAESGVTPVLHYDPLGRLAKTEFPDGSLSRTEFGPWKRVSFDRNDTVLESAWHSLRAGGGYAEQGKDPAKEQRAAQKAAAHAGTPSSFYADSMGRPVLGVVCNGKDAADKDRLYTTFTALDIEGNVREIRDARGNSPAVYKYDMLGRRAGQNSMDAGPRWELSDPAGNPVLRWDGRDHVFSFEYDALQRPASARVRGGDGGAALDCVYERTVYGENRPDEYSANLRGKVFRQYDTAGKTEFPRWDFKGNALESVREFCADYKNAPDWTEENLGDASLFDEDLPAYTRRMAYDALSRTVSTVSPDGSETRPAFGEAGLLKQVRVAGPGADEKLFVRDISYNARGQRERIVYADKNENSLASADYSYDAETFRLLRLKTEKAGGGLLQELHYTYDPAGNISETEDKAAPAVFFNNFKAEPRGIYTYDALYRLTQAEGREHAGQALDFGQCDNWQDLPFLKNYSPGDAMAWRKYIQRYAYDPAGNMLEMRHAANGGSWTRTCAYEAGSNRLSETQAGGQNYAYAHHPRHGFITSLPHLSVMEWNFRDELRATARQEVCGGGAGPETVYYVYNAAGERVRKVTETGGAKKEERLYLGETEIYKKHSGSHSGLERATLHVSDGSRRIAMIDTRSGADDGTEERTVRFQLADHLGSACLELSDAGEIISSEEFHPFGTTASQAVNKDIKTAAKRYRYTGKERDSESGLEYHSARYYLPWLARWLKPDPAGLRDGVNVFV
ncbi:MAG: insecticidal toxin complex protein, partial [Cytophagales bacterium]|nr:insecticidal toxin complex protein [Cytophagales bacterium]